MTKAEKNEPLYLVNPDSGHVEIVAGDDVDSRRLAGWNEPKGEKANGEKWNGEDSLEQRKAAVEVASYHAKVKACRHAKEAKAIEDAEKASDEAKVAADDHPDLKVQVVQPAAKKAKK